MPDVDSHSEPIESPCNPDPIETPVDLKGWHARALAHPYPNPHSFVPRRENLKLALLRNSPAEPEGFSLAIFAESKDVDFVVVDAMGRVLSLPATSPDVNGLLDLGRATLDLPLPGEFFNQWRIKHKMTCRPIDMFYYVCDRETRETSVYGYSPTDTELESPTEGYTYFPAVLRSLFGFALEARDGYTCNRNGGNADLEVVSKVMEALGDLSAVCQKIL